MITISKRIDQLNFAPPLTLTTLIPVVPDNSVEAHQTTLGDVYNLLHGNDVQLFKQQYVGSAFQKTNTVPIVALPAPGPNKMYAVIPGTVAYRLSFIANAYDFGANGVQLVSSTLPFTYAVKFGQNQVNGGVSTCSQATDVQPNSVDNLSNLPLLIYAPDGDATQGDGIITISFDYRIIDFN